ncbi:MAG TPA: PmoA family protein [Clostridia bacterium]|nr:PmoA family protein [Clostridia bacterium]
MKIQPAGDRIRVEVNGRLLTEYFYTNVPRPFCYPLIGPGGAPMTRNWPMQNVPDEEHDHPHHRSLWFTHGSVNGHDFWSEQGAFGKIVHDRFLALESGKESGLIKTRNNWIAADGRRVCTDERTLRFFNPGNKQEQVLDFEIVLHAADGAITFGDTKEGTMGVRLAETMRLKGKTGNGHIVNSDGIRDGATWGKRAAWCDYFGSVNGKTVGLAIFDHPANPRHPTWWHVRDYGLFAANPFGQHDFEGLSDKAAGNLVVPAGQSITFRYRLYLHEGDEKQGQVARRYEQYKSAPIP